MKRKRCFGGKINDNDKDKVQEYTIDFYKQDIQYGILIKNNVVTKYLEELKNQI